jgi:hypothetical protein
MSSPSLAMLCDMLLHLHLCSRCRLSHTYFHV